MDGLAALVFSQKGTRVVFIIASIFVIRLFVNKIASKIISHTSTAHASAKRIRTLTGIFNTFISVLAYLIGIFMILKELGFDITPLLASAGVVGLAVGFGAQALVKDVISGFFLILEGQFDEGDKVEINGKKGTIEKITLRTVWIRGEKQEIHIFPAGSISFVTNFTKD